MRTKTLNQIAQEAATYAVAILDIERALLVKQAIDEKKASVEMRTSIGGNIENICREYALLIAADRVRSDGHLIAKIESKLYAYLENLPSYSSLYKNRLDAELAEDKRIMKKTKGYKNGTIN
ncbi:MAG: hypothetical protein GX777_09720 [Fastidiosipila sp.]|nr:hypothetical protein [Fastidiosipila sp.]